MKITRNPDLLDPQLTHMASISTETQTSKPQYVESHFVEPTDDPSCTKALACAGIALEKKGENVRILQLKNLSGFTDYFVIVSGMSNKQLQAIADGIEAKFKEKFKKTLSKEGYAEGRWILIDLGDVIVHLFLDAMRSYYHLEAIWQQAPYIKIPSKFYSSDI
jgi:ribosome-associated protein